MYDDNIVVGLLMLLLIGILDFLFLDFVCRDTYNVGGVLSKLACLCDMGNLWVWIFGILISMMSTLM